MLIRNITRRIYSVNYSVANDGGAVGVRSISSNVNVVLKNSFLTYSSFVCTGEITGNIGAEFSVGITGQTLIFISATSGLLIAENDNISTQTKMAKMTDTGFIVMQIYNDVLLTGSFYGTLHFTQSKID